jgi:hypothetical protein
MRFVFSLLKLFVTMMRPRQALRYVLITAGYVILIGVITGIFIRIGKYWILYSIIMGVIFGLTIGFVMLVKVSKKVQIAIFGAIAGMGVDLLVTGFEKGGPHTAINSLATLISDIIVALQTAAAKTGLPSLSEACLSVGLWVFFGVLGLLMLFGSLEESAT